jgi:RimJ/RimL family protein N-acetyltransferase
MTADIGALARAYLEAIERGAPAEEIAAFFAEDAIQEEFPNLLNPSGARRDVDALREASERGRRAMASQRYEIDTLLTRDDTVALEVRWTGVLAIPLGTLPAGFAMRARFAVFLEYRDGRIVRQRNYDCFEAWDAADGDATPGDGLVASTDRLRIRRLVEGDAAFILDLLNQPSFLRFIGDRGVRSQDDARAYIRNGPIESYRANGHGLYAVELLETGVAIGMCGLLKRPTLDDPDIGFAFLPAYWSKGYAMESARAVLEHADALGLERIVAITSVDNESSMRLLERLGFVFETMVKTGEEGAEVRLFARG